MSKNEHSDNKDSLILWGAVSMGAGVMIGAGIFSLIGLVLVFVTEKWFLKLHEFDEDDPNYSKEAK